MHYQKLLRLMTVRYLWLGLLLAMVSTSWASSFYIAPVELFFSKEQKTVVLNIENRGAQPLLLQINEGFTKLSNNFIINPTIFQVAAKTKRHIQIGLKISPLEQQEQIFTLLVKELVKKVNKTNQINFVIDFAVRAYVQPNHEVRQLFWQVEPQKVILHNNSNVHLKVAELYITKPKQQEKIWEMPQEQAAILLANTTKYWQPALKQYGDFELHAVIYWRNEPEMIYQKIKI